MIICTYTNSFKKSLLINVYLFIKATKEKGWEKKRNKLKKQMVVLHPHIIQWQKSWPLNIPIVKGIPGFSSSSDPQPEFRSSNTFTAGKLTLNVSRCGWSMEEAGSKCSTFI